jgi:serine/threonine protein phosphatase 1
MRILAIGDLHGCSRALDTLLAVVQPTPQDLLITLGDYVDRGPDSRGVLDRLLRLRDTHQLVALLGNHDLMMLEARSSYSALESWLHVGGDGTLESYAPPRTEGSLDDVPAEHWDFLEAHCREWYETERHYFVHANAYADLPLAEQPTFMLRWEKLLPDARPHESGKVMVCGHTRQQSGVPLDLGHAVCIDTWPDGAGWLTCLEAQSGKLWQANQRGEHRSGWLGSFPEGAGGG